MEFHERLAGRICNKGSVEKRFLIFQLFLIKKIKKIKIIIISYVLMKLFELFSSCHQSCPVFSETNSKSQSRFCVVIIISNFFAFRSWVKNDLVENLSATVQSRLLVSWYYLVLSTVWRLALHQYTGEPGKDSGNFHTNQGVGTSSQHRRPLMMGSHQ